MTLAVDMRSGASPHIDLWRYGNCKSTRHNLHWHSSGGPPRQPMMLSYDSIDLLADTVAMSSDVPDYRTIRKQDDQVKVILWYMISCSCGLIVIRSIKLEYLSCMNTITFGICGNLYNARLFENPVSAKENIRMWHECKPQSTLLSKSWKPNMGAHVYTSWLKFSIKGTHCSGNERNKI